MTIVKILKEEDKLEGKYMSPIKGTPSEFESTINAGMNESLEFFINNQILETLSSYCITDQPHGFFKFLLGVIQDIISSVTSK